MKLDKHFFKMDALVVAKELLGKILCRRIEDKVIKYTITETECYKGTEDSASHAYRGITQRNKIMYEEGGVLYIYLCYGIHNLLNIVTGESGNPQAVLIRGVKDFSEPGRVAKSLKIDCSLNGIDITNSDMVRIEDSDKKIKYKTAPRIGISYANQRDKNRRWRFLLIDM